MSKWLSARVIHLLDGESVVEIEDSEKAISAEFEFPHVWVVVVKESNRKPEGK